MSVTKRIVLSTEEIPSKWYNILPDLPRKLPPLLNPATGKEISAKNLEPLFVKEAVKQEFSNDRWIPIPREVIEVYELWRPTPLIRALRLEKALKTPAKIYYKFEGVSPTGSHKPNTAVAQAYYASKEGIEILATETGAGQWGSALAFSTAMYGLKARVYMVKASYYQKPYRRVLMEIYGAEVIPSPSDRTKAGKEILGKDPGNPGSLGIAISEAIEDALSNDGVKYSLGSVMNHVLIHQTVVGLEAKKQLALIDEYPDIVVGCVGGGSNFSGLFWPFYYDKVSKKAEKPVEFLAVESKACPSLNKGVYFFDHGDTSKLTPLIKMYTIGHDFIPPPIHAGGLRYHGAAPTLSLLVHLGEVKTVAYNQVEVFEAATLFASTEGIVPAPESAHAVKAVLDLALECKKKNEEKVILFNLSGHGLLDLKAYDEYLKGKLPPYENTTVSKESVLEKILKMYPWLKKLNSL
ncbi:MAG: TrpB-like pyridoxal phosphate-dependent enzyme [Thermoprotei archaeon]|nr:MAG: TrpB-like pyridoxal phosphate-dependent enzyme [Thermoprotei archaeon]